MAVMLSLASSLPTGPLSFPCPCPCLCPSPSNQQTDETKRKQQDLERLRRDLGEGDRVPLGLYSKPTPKSEMDISLNLGAGMRDESDESADDELEGECCPVWALHMW